MLDLSFRLPSFRGLWTMASMLLIVTACSNEPTTPFIPTVQNPNMPTPCAADTDCAEGQVCLAAECQADPNAGFSCITEGCPADFTCMPNGNCQADVECISDADCCGGQTDCQLSCNAEYICTGTECTTGESRPCSNACHLGVERCDNGAWTECDAAVKTDIEICGDGIDNDCDPTTIEEACPVCDVGNERVCEGPCEPSSGVEICGIDGQWGPCSAPTDCTCTPGETASEPCGDCGFLAGLCDEDGVWRYDTVCMSEGICAAGTEEEQACGSCGVQRRTCSDTCSWSEWGECEVSPDAVCSPGDDEEQACGQCGSQLRTCTDSCEWGEWGDCNAGGGCAQGDQQTKSCGLCGVQVATCDSQCQWGEWSGCTNEGSCSPGTVESESCGMCGSRERTCGDDCQWGAWSSCNNQGVCDPGELDYQPCGPSESIGICQVGEQVRGCTASCQWNPWSSCAGAVYGTFEVCGNGIDEDCDGEDDTFPDNYEPNNACAACTLLTDSTSENSDVDVTVFGSFDNVTDIYDYYCFQGEDNPEGWFDLWGKEHVRVTLSGQTGYMDGDLSIYKGVTACLQGDALASSVTIGTGDEAIDWTEDEDADDSALYIIEVRNWGTAECYETYTLEVSGLN